jgi:hypothetical protein
MNRLRGHSNNLSHLLPADSPPRFRGQIPRTGYQLFNDPNGCAGIQFFNGKNCKSSGSRHAPSYRPAGEEAPADLKLMNVDPLLSIIHDDWQKF